MSVFGRVMLIPYFMAYLLHYFYDVKTGGDRKKTDFRFGISIEKYTNKRNKFFLERY